MKTAKNYNIYFFISTFIRNIIDVYSVIYLYKLDFSINDIIAIYAISYFLGYFISSFSIYIGNKIGYKYILMTSSIMSGVTFYIINTGANLYIIAIFLALSMFTYYPIKHYYGINLLKHKKQIGANLILTYVAILLSSYMVSSKARVLVVVSISLLGIIPALFIKKENIIDLGYSLKIDNYRLKFFFFDQFRIIFLLLEPLYLYLISNNIKYVGIFNIVLTISSIIFVYLLSNKINIFKTYKYINLIFVLILFLKLNIHNHMFLLIIAFLEGIGIRMNELVSTINLYSNKDKHLNYVITSEKIFCILRALILSIIYFLSMNLKVSLYILLIGIFILSFKYHEDIT